MAHNITDKAGNKLIVPKIAPAWAFDADKIADHARSLSDSDLIRCWAKAPSNVAHIYDGEINYREQEAKRS